MLAEPGAAAADSPGLPGCACADPEGLARAGGISAVRWFEAVGISILALQYGQIPRFPASSSLTFNARSHAGQLNRMPISDETSLHA